MNHKTLSEALSEYYDIGMLGEAAQAEYYLICRYESQVSDRLLIRKNRLRAAGKAKFKECFAEIISRPNPFLSMIPKNQNWAGAYIPIQKPIKGVK